MLIDEMESLGNKAAWATKNAFTLLTTSVIKEIQPLAVLSQ